MKHRSGEGKPPLAYSQSVMTDDHARIDMEAKMTKPIVSPTGSGPSTADRAIPMEAALKVILPARLIRDMLLIEAD